MTTDIIGSFCCHVNFLAGERTAKRWLGQHEGGDVLGIADAYELGQLATLDTRLPPTDTGISPVSYRGASSSSTHSSSAVLERVGRLPLSTLSRCLKSGRAEARIAGKGGVMAIVTG